MFIYYPIYKKFCVKHDYLNLFENQDKLENVYKLDLPKPYSKIYKS